MFFKCRLKVKREGQDLVSGGRSFQINGNRNGNGKSEMGGAAILQISVRSCCTCTVYWILSTWIYRLMAIIIPLHAVTDIECQATGGGGGGGGYFSNTN